MYILVNKSNILLGLFTDKTWLNSAIKAVRESEPYGILYYQKVEVNNFDSTLINFFTLHHEKLIEISMDVDSVE